MSKGIVFREARRTRAGKLYRAGWYVTTRRTVDGDVKSINRRCASEEEARRVLAAFHDWCDSLESNPKAPLCNADPLTVLAATKPWTPEALAV